MSKLSEANEYQNKNRVDFKDRPLFHLTAPVGWLNDPNGFSNFNGTTHLFFQYNPFSTKWNSMHWGHVVTDDFITWKELPVALAPEDSYDDFGCFSGSALTTDDGRHALIYTGVILEEDDSGEVREVQTQCLTMGDGVTYEKFEGNPVIDGDDLPEGFSRGHFRDPKVWREDGVYKMLVGGRDQNSNGHALLYESSDLKNWSFVSSFADNQNGKFGKMWECPDLFKLDSRHILLVSPQDIVAYGPNSYNGDHSLVIVGDVDKESQKLVNQEVEFVDYGTEFYAPQTILTEDGRRVMVAWMNSWDMIGSSFTDHKWNGMMTVPRELELKNGKLYQQPVKELKNYWTDEFKVNNLKLSGEVSFPEINGRALDLTVEITSGDYRKFSILFAKNDRYESSITYNRDSGTIELDRTYSGLDRDIVCERKFYLEDPNEKIKIRLVLDKYSAEAFINDGRYALSSLVYTPLEATDIVFKCEGTADVNIESHNIEVTQNFEKREMSPDEI